MLWCKHRAGERERTRAPEGLTGREEREKKGEDKVREVTYPRETQKWNC